MVAMAEFLIITGQSGAGRSQAGATFEDLGWFVIDNMPTALITKVAELVTSGPETSSADRVALVVGRRAGQLHQLTDAVAQLRATAGNRVKLLFLEASDEVLVRRYEGTRRRHPLSAAEGVAESIALERELLQPIRESADDIIDTTDLNVNQLRRRLIETFTPTAETMQIQVVSFGFKHGVPLDVDTVFDCRFLPNPHWVDELRPLTGLDEPVRRFVLDQPSTNEFINRVDHLLALVLPAYVTEGKSYLTIAVGCTGGRHRSVVLAEELVQRIGRYGFAPLVHHRDIDR
ncbi:MAG: RNase adapter protein RapZ [Acidimicrobiaceae bacterium]|nr:RNase adapter protein RapZ [Acidimicrobiaceae bacterium]